MKICRRLLLVCGVMCALFGAAGTAGAAAAPSPWLYTHGNHIYTPDGNIWMGRGANIQDTRSCFHCATAQPASEVQRRLHTLLADWKANFVRLTMESHDHFGNTLHDQQYRRDVVRLVRYIGQFPNTYVILALWHDPSLNPEDGFPSAEGIPIWEDLAREFHNDAHVIFGLSNEPVGKDGSRDAEVHARMSATVEAIRHVEARYGSHRHLIAVQGTYGWARHAEYYLQHPIAIEGGNNVIYEIHPYNGADDFEQLVVTPALSLPLVIGEFGPAPTIGMTFADAVKLVDVAERLQVPWLGWTFHEACPPNLIEKTRGNLCSQGMPLVPTRPWGEFLRDKMRHRHVP